VPFGTSWRAKTARPAVGVSRISKYCVEGAPTGSVLEGSASGAEDDEDGRDMLYDEDAVVEPGSSEGSILGDKRLMYGQRSVVSDLECVAW